MTPITLVVIIIVLSLISAGVASFELTRKTCQTTSGCGDPLKECIDGLCFCKPEYDDVLSVSGGLDVECVRSYGANCSSTGGSSKPGQLCNVYKNLVCDKEVGKCSCHKHDDDDGESQLIYDERLETCAAPPGGKCDLLRYAGPYEVGCVYKAECKTDPGREVDREFYGKCQCAKGRVRSGEGLRCVPELGSECEVDGDCDDIGIGGKGVVCLEGTCQCGRERLYDERNHKCRLKVGGGCEQEQENCVEGATCILKSGEDDEGHYRWDWECHCDLDWHEEKRKNNDTICVKDQNGDGCGSSHIKVFDEGRGRCSTRVGGECVDHGVNRSVSHAFCGTGRKCQCFEGYAKTKNGMCKKLEKEVRKEEETDKRSKVTSTPDSIITELNFMRSGAKSFRMEVSFKVVSLLIMLKCLLQKNN